MTGLLATSLLAIMLSSAALVYGWATASEAIIWASAGLSVVAGVLLALGYYHAARTARAIATGQDEPGRSR